MNRRDETRVKVTILIAILFFLAWATIAAIKIHKLITL